MRLRELLFAWVTVVCPCVLGSCDKGGGSLGQFNDIIESDAGVRYKLNQLSFTLNIKDREGRFVCLDRVDSVELKVNGRPWGVFTSEQIDTLGYAEMVINKIRFSGSPMDYLVLAPYDVKIGKAETAGDFVSYLKKRLVLTPGDYVCEVTRLKFKDLNDSWIELKPQIYKDFKVVENTTGSYIGEIEITIK